MNLGVGLASLQVETTALKLVFKEPTAFLISSLLFDSETAINTSSRAIILGVQSVGSSCPQASTVA